MTRKPEAIYNLEKLWSCSLKLRKSASPMVNELNFARCWPENAAVGKPKVNNEYSRRMPRECQLILGRKLHQQNA